jgi:hypothetical protein
VWDENDFEDIGYWRLRGRVEGFKHSFFNLLLSVTAHTQPLYHIAPFLPVVNLQMMSVPERLRGELLINKGLIGLCLL